MLPLERDGLVSISDGARDRRSRDLALTKAGAERLHRAAKLWVGAQKAFEGKYGARRAAALRALLREVACCDLGIAEDERPI